MICGRSAVAILVGIWMMTTGAGSLAQPEEAMTGSGVREYQAPEGRYVEASLPGRLENHVVATMAEGKREVLFLLAPLARPEPEPTQGEDDDEPASRCPEDAERARPPRSLYRLDVREEGELAVVHDDLPGDSKSIAAADLDGDGFDEIVLVRKSGIYEIRGKDLVPVVEGPDLRLAEVDGRLIVLETTRVGARLYGARTPGEPWTTLKEVDLPAKGRLWANTLMISRQIPTAFGRLENGSILLATAPTPAGKRRVQATVVEVTAEGEVSLVESWSRLPSAEDVLDRRLLIIDDEPVLLVTTKPAGKLAIFGEKGLRLFPVEHDRTRLGRPPRFEVDSHMNLWQQPVPVIVDVNGDGLKDLVIGYWKGIMDDRVVLDVYPREEDGSFSATVRTTAFDVKDGDRSLLVYGDDLDGDGLPDLLIRSEEILRLHPGLPSKRGAKLVDREARAIRLADDDEDEDDHDDEFEDEVVVEVSSGGGFSVTELYSWTRPRVADLDGDGRKEIYLIDPGSRRKPATFRAVWISPAP